MVLMDITRDELDIVYDILDEDQSGSVDYKEFTEQLYKMRTQHSHTLLVLIKHFVVDSRRKIGTLLSDQMGETARAMRAVENDIVDRLEAVLRRIKRAVTGSDL